MYNTRAGKGGGGGGGGGGGILSELYKHSKDNNFPVLKKERCVMMLFSLRCDELRVKIMYVTFLWTEGNYQVRTLAKTLR